MSVAAAGIAVLPLAFVVLVIPVVVGVYVYRDARRRGMNAALWTLVAALAPALVGFVAYLLVRGGHSNLRCPRCDARVEEDYLACPGCGAKLRAACANCGSPVEPEWEVCPRCARPLTHSSEGVEAPVQPKDSGLWKVLAVVVVVPALLVALLVVGFSVSSRVGSSALREVTVAELLEVSGSDADLEAWLAGFEGTKADGAHALAYTVPGSGARNDYFYLIYVPGVDGVVNRTSFGLTTGFFGLDPAFELEIGTDGTVQAPQGTDGPDGKLFCVAFDAEQEPDLRVSLNGRDLACSVERVAYNPTTFTVFALDELDEVPAPYAGSQDVYVEEVWQLAAETAGEQA